MKAYLKNILLTALAVPVFASVCAAQLTIDLTPTDDAMINGANPNTNYGNDQYLNAASEQSGYKFYAKFDASNLSGQIASIDLISAYYTSGRDRSANIFLLTNNDGSAVEWNDDTITWNNAPANVTNSYNGLVAGAGQTLTQIASSAGNTASRGLTINLIDGDVTQALLSALNTGDRTATLIFVYGSSSSQGSFYQIASTKHNSVDPLTISVTMVPEPSTYAMAIGLLAIGFVGFKRMRNPRR